LEASPKRPIPRGFITPLAHIRHVWLLCASAILFVWVATGQEQDRDLDTWIKNPAYTQVHPGISPDLFPIWPHIGKKSRRYHLADTVSDLKRCQVCRKPLKVNKSARTIQNTASSMLQSAPQLSSQKLKNAGTKISRATMYSLAKFRQFPLVVSAQRPIAYQKAARNKSADMPT